MDGQACPAGLDACCIAAMIMHKRHQPMLVFYFNLQNFAK
jgi:hypothetical protein